MLEGFISVHEHHALIEILMAPESIFHKHLQRIFDTVQYGSERAVWNCFVLVSGGKNGTKVQWVVKAPLLLKISA